MMITLLPSRRAGWRCLDWKKRGARHHDMVNLHDDVLPRGAPAVIAKLVSRWSDAGAVEHVTRFGAEAEFVRFGRFT